MLRRVIGLAVLGEAALAFGQATNSTGINIDYLHDSANTPVLSDLLRTYRDVNAIGTSYNSNSLAGLLDPSGWATQDSWYYLGDPNAIAHGDGTYAIRFQGQATIGVNTGTNSSATFKPITTYVSNQTYDAATNTTTASIVIPTGLKLSELYLTGTRRDASSAVNTGVTNIQLERPITPGGATPYSFNSTFTTQTIDIAKKVGVLRFMDFLGTNSNNSVNWSDRVTPTQVKLNPVDPVNTTNSRGKGGPLELAVALGNAANRDVWINIPAKASADYVTNVANLLKYGSDGVNPYTSPQASPVYKPLNSNLHVYVEYSNETWNTSGGFQQNSQLTALAKAELDSYSGGLGALNFDGPQNDFNLAARYSAEQTKKIADIFAGVYGDSALLTTVRPVLNWQKGNGNGTAFQASKILEGYYNNVNGNYVSNPKAVNTYIYGAGADAYYSGTVTATSTAADIAASADVSANTQWVNKVKDIAYATTFGVKPIAYEGGLSLVTSDKSLDGVKQAALADDAIRQVVVKNHNTWTSIGGSLFVYYYSSDQLAFGFSNANFDTNTPKLNALTDIEGAPSSTTYTVGTPILKSKKTVITGGQFTLSDKSAGSYVGDKALSLGGAMWTSYLINIPEAGTFNIGLDYNLAGTGGFKLLLGGTEIYSGVNLPGQASSKTYVGIPFQLLDLPAGVTSLRVLLNNTSSTLSIRDITLTPFPALIPIPEPATASFLFVGGSLLLRRKRRLQSKSQGFPAVD